MNIFNFIHYFLRNFCDSTKYLKNNNIFEPARLLKSLLASKYTHRTIFFDKTVALNAGFLKKYTARTVRRRRLGAMPTGEAGSPTRRFDGNSLR